MKKLKIIIPAILLIIAIGLLSAYFIYGSTLVDITSDKSISNALATDPKQPITIIKTAKNGKYFGIMYSDPSDNDETCYHFSSMTKAKLYKNKYHNLGISSTANVIENNDDEEDKLTNDILNDIDENTKTAESFLYTFEGDTLKDKKCSVFEYNDTGVSFDENTEEKEVTEKMQKLADSYKKIDEFDLPNEQFYIFPEVYELSKNANGICFEVGSVSVDEMKSRTMQQAKGIIKELKEEKQWIKYLIYHVYA